METSLWSQSVCHESVIADCFQIFSSLEQRHITLQHSNVCGLTVFICPSSWSFSDFTHDYHIISIEDNHDIKTITYG